MIGLDDSQWPMLIITFPPDGNVQDVEEFLNRLRECYARGEPFVSVVDARQVVFNVAHSRLRTMLAEGINKILEEYPGVKIGEVHVLVSAASRAAMTAGVLLRKRPFKTATVATMEEGIAWATALLAKTKK